MAEDRYTGDRAISKRRARFWNFLIWAVVIFVVLAAVYVALGVGV